MAVDGFVLDTSAYSRFFRGDYPGLRRYFTAKHRIVMPLVVVAELRAGFAAGNQQSYNQSNLIKFTSSPNVEVAGITDETTQQYANIFARLKAAGTPIGTNDLWIAACSLEHGLPLLTLDKDFQKIEAVQLVKI